MRCPSAVFDKVGQEAKVELTWVPGSKIGRSLSQSVGTSCQFDNNGKELDVATGRVGTLGLTNISRSNSIVTLPIYDGAGFSTSLDFPSVNIVGFLQAFINGTEANGNINVTVLNVADCSNTATNSTPTVSGSSPVPVRLIAPQ